jgi:hypothetical protein
LEGKELLDFIAKSFVFARTVAISAETLEQDVRVFTQKDGDNQAEFGRKEQSMHRPMELFKRRKISEKVTTG